MKKFFIFILTAIFIVLAVVFFVLLNLKFAFFSPDKVKSLAESSGFYNFATMYIKDEVVKKSGISLNDGANLAKLNNEINADKVKASINSSIDSLFGSLESKSANAVFPVTVNSDQTGFSFSKNADFTNNPALFLMQRLNYVLTALAICALLILTLAVLLAKPASAKLRTIGHPFITLAIILGAGLFLLLEVLPNYLNKLVATSAIVQDPRLVNAVSKLVSAALSRQTMYYAIEIIVLLILGAILVFIARADSNESAVKNDTKKKMLA